MSAQPAYRNGICLASHSRGTLLPSRECDAPGRQASVREPSAPDVPTLGGDETRHDSPHPSRPVEAFPQTRVEPFALPDALGFLSPPLASGELGWLAQYRVLRVLGAGGMG